MRKTSSTSNNSKKSKTDPKKIYWGETPKLTAEQTVEWLDGHRQFMWEIWRSNPGSRKKWEKINLGK